MKLITNFFLMLKTVGILAYINLVFADENVISQVVLVVIVISIIVPIAIKFYIFYLLSKGENNQPKRTPVKV